MTNRDHSDGWGVANYRGDRVQLWRAEPAAYHDSDFEAACFAAKSKTIIAHVRRASKGIPKLANVHPFVCGKWIFAHNGTLTSLETLRQGMMREISPRNRRMIQGETDSELIFYWLLRRLEDSHAIQGDRCRNLARMRQTFANGVFELERRNHLAESNSGNDKQAKLNFLLTNGTVLVGTRYRNTLFVLEKKANRLGGKPFRSVSVASEPPDDRLWREIPDRSVFSISSSVRWTLEPLETNAAAPRIHGRRHA